MEHSSLILEFHKAKRAYEIGMLPMFQLQLMSGEMSRYLSLPWYIAICLLNVFMLLKFNIFTANLAGEISLFIGTILEKIVSTVVFVIMCILVLISFIIGNFLILIKWDIYSMYHQQRIFGTLENTYRSIKETGMFLNKKWLGSVVDGLVFPMMYFICYPFIIMVGFGVTIQKESAKVFGLRYLKYLLNNPDEIRVYIYEDGEIKLRKVN